MKFKRMGLVLVFISMFLLTACGEEVSKTEEAYDMDEIVILHVLSMGTPPESGLDSFYKQLDALTIPELGCAIRITYIPWGNEKEEINIAIASGEYDLIPGGNFSDYRLQATKGAFVDINDYMDLVPKLEAHYKQYRDDYLEGCEIAGGLYGIPQYGVNELYSLGSGFFYREDLRKEWGLKPITNFETMEAYLYRGKKEYGGAAMVTDNRIWTALWMMLASDKYMEISSISETPYVVASIDDPYTPISRFETEEFQNIIGIMEKWYDDGIISPSILGALNNEGISALEMLKNGEKPCETNSTSWAISSNYIPALTELYPDWEWGFLDYSLDVAPAFIRGGTLNTVISISSKSNYPEIAMLFLEKLHIDQRYYDLLVYGVEGEHYQLIDGKISSEGVKSVNRFPHLTGASDAYRLYDPVSIYEKWDLVMKEYDEKAARKGAVGVYFPLDGFTFDSSNVNKIIKGFDDVLAYYLQPLYCGVTDNMADDYKEAIRVMKDASLEEYMEEVQRQLRDFKENR